MKDQPVKSIPPENHGAELLANERTFLAWIRTSIAVISFGFTITKLDSWLSGAAEKSGTGVVRGIAWEMPAGLLLIVFGGLLPVFAAWHYRKVQRQIENGAVKAEHGMVVSITALVSTLAAFVVFYFLKSGMG